MKATKLTRVLCAAAAILLLTVMPGFAVEDSQPETAAETEEPTEFDLGCDDPPTAPPTEAPQTEAPATTRRVTTTAATTRRTAQTEREEEEEPAREEPARPYEEPAREEEPDDEEEEETTKVTTTLPKGYFYVYLELNNSTDHRLRYLMKGPGLVKEPDQPVRKGYIFDGWYTDAAFTKKWDFATDIATKSLTIYAKWAPDKSTVVYIVRAKQTEGGTIEVNPSKATEGEIININAFPEYGMRVKPGSVMVNGEPTDILNFTMPDGDVTVSVTFEKIPVRVSEESSNLVWILVLGGAAALLMLTLLLVAVQRRRRMLEAEEDETPADVDATAVVSSGFDENGQKVRDSKEPVPESDGNDYLDD